MDVIRGPPSPLLMLDVQVQIMHTNTQFKSNIEQGGEEGSEGN